MKELDEIRNAALWRRLYRSVARIVEQIAMTCQVTSMIITMFLVLIVLLWGQSIVTGLPVEYGAAIALMAGILYFPLLVVGLTLLSLSWGGLTTELGKKRFSWAGLALLALSPWPVLMVKKIQAPLSWFILGIIAGILIEVMRRGGRMVGRVLPKVAYLMSNPDPSSREQVIYPKHYLDEAIAGCFPNPFYCPIWPDESAKVFISYSHKTGIDTASELHNLLCKHGVESFRDEDNIRKGFAWRKVLTRKISEANVFISLADSTSVRSPWPTAEMEAALVKKWYTGLPNIIVLKSPEQLPNKNDNREISPIFDSLLRLSTLATNDNQPRLIEENESTLSAIVSGLQFPHFHSKPAVIPKKLASLILHYFSPFLLALICISSIGIFVGWSAIPLVLLDILHKFNVKSYLAFHNLLWLIFPICGYWIGYVGRLIIFARFQVNMPTLLRKIVFVGNLIALIGFIGLFTLGISQVSTLVIGWAIVLCDMGWLFAGVFWHYTHLDRPEVKRLTD